MHTTGGLAGIATVGSAVCMTCTWSVDLTAISCVSANAAEALEGIMTLPASDLPQAREICTRVDLEKIFELSRVLVGVVRVAHPFLIFRCGAVSIILFS